MVSANNNKDATIVAAIPSHVANPNASPVAKKNKTLAKQQQHPKEPLASTATIATPSNYDWSSLLLGDNPLVPRRIVRVYKQVWALLPVVRFGILALWQQQQQFAHNFYLHQRLLQPIRQRVPVLLARGQEGLRSYCQQYPALALFLLAWLTLSAVPVGVYAVFVLGTALSTLVVGLVVDLFLAVLGGIVLGAVVMGLSGVAIAVAALGWFLHHMRYTKQAKLKVSVD